MLDRIQRDEPDWQRLTSLADKRRYYEIDSLFVEGFGDLRARLDDGVYDCLHRHALVLFKPEAIRSRKIEPSLRFFRDCGFVPAASAVCRFDQATIHAIWRYQLQRATRDRVRLYSRWGDPEPGLMVAFRCLEPATDLPASVRLQGRKGHAFPERRRPGDLRARLDSPNTLMTFFHASDEPADMVRDLAICVPARDRAAFIDDMAFAKDRVAERDLLAITQSLYARVPHVSASPAAAATRIGAALRASSLDKAALSAALDYVAAVHADQTPLVFDIFERLVADALDDLDPYDVFAFATQHIERDGPGAAELPGDCVAGWHRRARVAQEAGGQRNVA